MTKMARLTVEDGLLIKAVRIEKGWSVISRIVGVMISLIACHLHFLSSEHFGC